MDALSGSNPAGFQHLCSHISLFHQPMSAGFDAFTRKVLRDDVRLRRSDTKYSFWNVPGMGTQLGKVLPFDIYGQHVLIDEAELFLPGKKITHGVMRYAVAAAGVRRREGGRRLYVYVTMNFALACGGIFGGAFLYHSRRRFTFLQRRPALSIALSLGVCAATIPVVRSLFKIMAVGITIAERQHAKALHVTQCYDCLCDIYDFTDDQISDVKLAKLPAPKPGMPAIAPEQEKAFAAAMEMQSLVLGRDLTTIRSIIKKNLQKRGLLQLPAAAAAPAAAATSSSKSPSSSQAAGASEGDASVAVTAEISKAQRDAEARQSAAEEAAQLINARSVPASMLCDVHRGLRAAPDTYCHPDKYPIFPLDRTLAKMRPPTVPEVDAA